MRGGVTLVWRVGSAARYLYMHPAQQALREWNRSGNGKFRRIRKLDDAERMLDKLKLPEPCGGFSQAEIDRLRQRLRELAAIKAASTPHP